MPFQICLEGLDGAGHAAPPSASALAFGGKARFVRPADLEPRFSFALAANGGFDDARSDNFGTGRTAAQARKRHPLLAGRLRSRG